LRDQDIVSKVHDDEITSTFRLRSLEPVKGQPWTYVAFGVKEVHRSITKQNSPTGWWHGTTCASTNRTIRKSPSGLLVAEYGEQQMVGEKDNGLEQSSVLMDDAKK